MLPGTASFAEFLRYAAPHLLPGLRIPAAEPDSGDIPHGTTVLALIADGGVVMAGDRRATMGNLIADHALRKVFAVDGYSMVGIAGTVAIGVELVKLFQIEVLHFEKMEHVSLSIQGKANCLSTLIRNNLNMAMQGLAVLPLYGGFDPEAEDPASAGRIFGYDVVGGVYEQRSFDGIGSGSTFAKAALKKRYRPGLPMADAVRIAVEALYDAADEDAATGGPDVIRDIYPIIVTASAEGVHEYSDEEAAATARSVVAGRRENPGG